MNYGILFNRNSGKVVKMLESEHSIALLQLFALQGNVSATRDYIVIDKDGICRGYYEGKKNDMPTICRDMEGKPCEDFGFSMEMLVG